MVHLALDGSNAAVDVGGALQVVPEAVGVHLFLELGQFLFQVLQVKTSGDFRKLLPKDLGVLYILFQSDDHDTFSFA